MREQWKRIATHPDYMVSNLGKIRKGERFLALSMNAHGYQKVNLEGGLDGTRTKLVHRVVALTWLKNPDDLPVVHHKNAVKIDNRAVNLEWCSHSQNSRYAAETRFSENNGKPAKAHPTFRELMEEVRELKEIMSRIERECFDD